MNAQQERLSFRLKEAELSTKRFLKVGSNKLIVTPKHPEGEYIDKAAFEKDFQNHLYGPEDLGSYPRWGILGSDFLVLLDFDKPEIYEIISKLLPPTFEASSPRHGLPHRYYVVCGEQVPNNKFHLQGDNDSKGRPNPCGEIRADNHYLVAPGTIIRYEDLTTHEWKTGIYEITNDAPIARLEYTEFMTAVKPYLMDTKGERVLTDAKLENGVSIGERHDTVFRYACRLVGDNPEGRFSGTVALDMLRRWNETKLDHPVEDEFLQRVIMEGCEYASKETDVPVEQILALGFSGIADAKTKPLEDKPTITIENLMVLDKKFADVYEGKYLNHEIPNEKQALELLATTLYSYKFKTAEVNDLLSKSKLSKWNTKQDLKERILTKAQTTVQKLQEPPKGEGDDKERESQADRALKLFFAEGIELFHDQYGTEFAQIPITDAIDAIDTNPESIRRGPDDNTLGKHENLPIETATTQAATRLKVCESAVNCVNASMAIVRLKDEKLKTYLAHLLYDAEKKAMGADAIASALLILKYDAGQGKQYTLFNRVAPDSSGDGSIWLDMADSRNRAYHITKEGWTIEENIPILFRRYAHQQPLREAVKGGDAWKLLEYVNVGSSKSEYSEHKKLLLMVQIASDIIPEIPHSINAMYGFPGSHKTTAQRFIRQTIDPSSVPVLRMPRDENAALQNLDHHYMPVFDNLDSIPKWFSSMLCCAVTGAGQESRALYTDDDSFIRNFRRCVLINGVNLPAQKGDLLNRITIHQAEPEPNSRRTEKDLNESYEKTQPEILGGLLDAVSKSLKIIETIKPNTEFRLADFTTWGCALAEALGKSSADFILAMRENLESQNTADIENNVCADAFLSYCSKWASAATEKDPVTGTPDAIFSAVTNEATLLKINTSGKKWPSAACYFTRKLNDSKNAILSYGWNFEVVPMGSKREMRIWSLNPVKTPPKYENIVDCHKAERSEITRGECSECKQSPRELEYITENTAGEIAFVCYGCGENIAAELYRRSQQ